MFCDIGISCRQILFSYATYPHGCSTEKLTFVFMSCRLCITGFYLARLGASHELIICFQVKVLPFRWFQLMLPCQTYMEWKLGQEEEEDEGNNNNINWYLTLGEV